MKEGCLVTRKSYNGDIYFKIESIKDNNAILKGIDYRIIADALLDDLVSINQREYKKFLKNIENNIYKNIDNFINEINNKNNFIREDDSSKKIGNVLHIDGDNYYLKCCMEKYKRLQVPANGVYIKEECQPEQIIKLLKEYNPDILVITGHDNLKRGNNTWSDIKNYRNSKYFIEAVKEARNYNSNYDDLVIIAGGCQSYYDELIEAGANFASSPNRVLIHHIDHAIVASKVAMTSVREYVDSQSLSNLTLSGIGGIGGVETLGKSRIISPKLKIKKIY